MFTVNIAQLVKITVQNVRMDMDSIMSIRNKKNVGNPNLELILRNTNAKNVKYITANNVTIQMIIVRYVDQNIDFI